jgi:toxin CptA
MSIAVTAFVGPSRTARRLLAGWALAQCAAAWAVGCAAPSRFAGAGPISALLAGAGLVLGAAALRRPKTHLIDISGTGELRVTVKQNVRMPRPVRQAADGDVAGRNDQPLALLPGSVSWPGLIVLRLGVPGAAPGSTVHVVPVWRDSVDGDTWRSLVVALAVIGRPGRAEDGFETNR